MTLEDYSDAFATLLNFPLLFLILTVTTLYSGHMASESCTSDVMLFTMISGKWNVVLRIPGFTSSVTLALMSTFPLGDSKQTISPSEIALFFASSGFIIKESSVKIVSISAMGGGR